MGRSSKRTVERIENKVLATMERAVSPRRAACLSLRDIATATGVSVGQARNACRNLERDGFVVVEPRFAPDGGQLANGYRLTRSGRERLRLAMALEPRLSSPEPPRSRSRDPAVPKETRESEPAVRS